jgi:hypothetical protein
VAGLGVEARAYKDHAAIPSRNFRTGIIHTNESGCRKMTCALVQRVSGILRAAGRPLDLGFRTKSVEKGSI